MFGTLISDKTVHFYPRPPRGGRPWLCMVSVKQFVISIHALREEGDCRTPSP